MSRQETSPTMSSDNARALAQNSAPVFAALGDSTRLLLVSRLSDGQHYSISQLAAGLQLSRQGVTKHLRVLEGAGVVVSARKGRETRFAFATGAFNSLQSYLDHVGLQWDQALGRLQEFVEESPQDSNAQQR